jgi:hypothetical protein
MNIFSAGCFLFFCLPTHHHVVRHQPLQNMQRLERPAGRHHATIKKPVDEKNERATVIAPIQDAPLDQ